MPWRGIRREWRPPPPRYLPAWSVHSEGRDGEEREVVGDRDGPRVDPGGAPIFKERVLYRFCWLWFSESLKVSGRLDMGLSLNYCLVNRKGLEPALEAHGGGLVRGKTGDGIAFTANIEH